MNSLAKDNYYVDCPAVMDYSAMTDYRTSHRREQFVKTINGLTRDNDHRLFLQNNGRKIMDKEWAYYKANHSCFANSCIHTYPTRPTPGSLHEEMKLYNTVRSSGKQRMCRKEDDYRMTYDQPQ